MDFKRKIALIILVSLIMGLFGSYMLAMETAVIKDFNGQIVQLSDAQRTALRSCETLKQMIEDTGMKEISFDGASASFATGQTWQNLAQIINDTKSISLIVNDDELIDLYKLVEYAKAPEEIIQLIAKKVYMPVNRKILALQKNDNSEAKLQLENLNILRAEIISTLKYYEHFGDFLKDCPQLFLPDLNDRKIFDKNFYFLNLGSDNLVKCGIVRKIASIEEIDLLKGLGWTSHVRYLNIEGHALTACSVKLLKQVFPNLRKIQAGNNEIFDVNEAVDDSVERIELGDNAFSSIALKKAHSFKNTEVLVDDFVLNRTCFNPNTSDKCKAWLNAFKIRSKIAVKVFPQAIAQDYKEKTLYVFKGLVLGNLINNSLQDEPLRHELNSWEFYILMGSVLYLYSSISDIKDAVSKELGFRKLNEPYHYGVKIKGIYYTPNLTQKVYPSPYTYNLFGKN